MPQQLITGNEITSTLELTGNTEVTNLSYTGTLTGNTGIIDIGSGQIHKDSSGNVGIGTSSPGYKLEVTGNIKASGYVWGATNVYAGDGSVSDNAFARSAGNGTGMYFPAPNTIGFSTVATERLRIDSSGNVGIGTSSPGAKLNIYGGGESIRLNGSASYLSFRSADNVTRYGYIQHTNTDLAIRNDMTGTTTFGNNGSIHLTIGSSGNVGIGTNSPAYKLDLDAGVPAFSYTSASKISITNNNAYSTASYYGINTLSLVNTSTTAGSGVGISFTTYGSGSGSVSSISSIATNNSGYGSALVFQTRDTAANDAERLRIDSAGNVGIGTISPQSSLHVNVSRTSSTSAVCLTLSDNVTGAQTNGVYKAIRSLSNSGNSISEIRFLETDGTNNNTGLAFATQSIAGGLTERMRIDYAGNISIGSTTSNGYKFLISGTDGACARIVCTGRSDLTLTSSGAISYDIGTNSDSSFSIRQNGTYEFLKIGSGGTVKIPYQGSFNTTTPGSGTYGLHFNGQTTYDYATGITWNGGYSGTDTAQAGVYVQGSGSYGTKMYFATTDSYAVGSKTAMLINELGTIYTSRSYLQATGSLRAPLFYDSNDTAYYCDPAGASVLNGLKLVNATDNASGGDAALWIQGTSTDWGIYVDKPSYDYGIYYNCASSHTYGILGRSNGTTYFRVGTDALVHITGTRSPIFYDYDNTAYYCDPASTTNLNALTAVSITESSSITLKENINPLENALNKINQLVGVSYQRKATKKNEVGLIAEEVNKIIPEIVSRNDNGDPEGIQYTKLTAYLIEAVKELTKEIELLKNG